MSSPTIDEPVISPSLAQAFRDGCENTAQARMAYARFVRRRSSPRRSALVVGGCALLGMLVSIGSLYAANGAPLRWLGVAGAASEPERARPRPKRLAAAAVQASPVFPVASAPTSRAPTIALVAPTQTAEAAPAATMTGRGAPVASASREAAVTASASEATRLRSASEQWQRAAEGLRDGNFESADAALGAVIARSSGTEREAAQLARGQLLLSNGRRAEALTLLQFLQHSAELSSVRRKAGELVLRAQRNAAEDRSRARGAGANQP